MKSLFTALVFAGLSSASPVSGIETRQNGVGDGPFAPAGFYTYNGFADHTFYAPRNKPTNTKLPVLLWGNGGCSADATGQAPFLTQLASYGVLVIASGTPGGGGSTTAEWMRASINFITENAGRGDFAHVDASRITAAGWSCGGVEAYGQINDDRVQHIGIWNSGLLNNYDSARQFRKPVFFFLGGPSDIAYQNGERDYSYMPSGTPKWKGNLNVGHGGTYTDYNGGKYGIIGARWVQWILRGNASASDYLTGSGARSDGWNVVYADLDNIRVTPIDGGGDSSTTTPPSSTTTKPGSTSITSTSADPTPTGGGGNCAGLFGQCGGEGWTGPTCCSQGTCKFSNPWYSQCL
ncbi:hypothetical protein C7999DRAFT_41146 [Corynascus novoguineensis]|uniref:CBM1 domain-containing protein n=1 Tax=Corynascus novoguineensis TaxID=1126955 RepID=A0AAN7CUP7_9PEZI|nr:hypothetical protein C7999DRAFT_41146 [Corynascus novoguineensis]